jgi:hypothetical protein
MRGLLDAFQFLTIVSTGILTGAQIYVAVSVISSMSDFTQAEGVRLHQELLTWRPGRIYKPVTSTALAAAIACCVLVPLVDDIAHEGVTLVLSILTLVVLVVYAYITLGMEFPINKQVRSWERGTVPEEYAQLREHWDVRQRIKIFCVAFAFATSLIATILSLH